MKFEEQFPSLVDERYDLERGYIEDGGDLEMVRKDEGLWVETYDVKNHCLDKQKVIEAIKENCTETQARIIFNKLGVKQ